MGFIKGIGSEADHLIIDLIGNLLGDTIGNAALYSFFLVSVDKVLPLRFHHLCLLFGHGTAHQITSSITVACQTPDDLHNLLLVNNTAIGSCKNRFKLWTVICNGISVASSLNILRNKVHRARTIQRNTGYDLCHVLRLQLFHKLLHPGTLQLEYSLGPPTGYEFPYIFILQIQAEHILITHTTHFGCILYNRQCTKPQKVHFQKPQLLQCGHSILRGYISLRSLRKRYKMIHRLRCDHNTRRMNGSMTRQSLQLLRHI